MMNYAVIRSAAFASSQREERVSDELNRQSIANEEHLKLLALGYMISAAISAFFSLFALMYSAMGAFIATMISKTATSTNAANQPPPAFIGWLLGGIGFVLFLLMIGIAALKLRAAFCIKQRKSRTFCMVIAVICCLGIPYGTLLGVLTIVVLERDSVKILFERPGAI
jgi:hypothetical protein